jgi:hypothetical protein
MARSKNLDKRERTRRKKRGLDWKMELWISIFSVPNGQMAVWNGKDGGLSLHLELMTPSTSY